MINKTKSKIFLCIFLVLAMPSSINLCCLANNSLHATGKYFDAISPDSIDVQSVAPCLPDQDGDETPDELADQLPLTRQFAKRNLLANFGKNKIQRNKI